MGRRPLYHARNTNHVQADTRNKVFWYTPELFLDWMLPRVKESEEHMTWKARHIIKVDMQRKIESDEIEKTPFFGSSVHGR
jgi:hypothetical protein